MKREIWKDIKDYEGIYKVSSFGRVRSVSRMWSDKNGKLSWRQGRVLSSVRPSMKYPSVSLCKCGSKKSPLVHKLVAQNFIPNPEGKPEVNHRDGVKTNNVVSNLEWVTHRENVRHAIEMGLATIPHPGLGEDHYDAVLTDQDVLQIRNMCKRGCVLREIARKFGVHETTISHIKFRRTWKHI